MKETKMKAMSLSLLLLALTFFIFNQDVSAYTFKEKPQLKILAKYDNTVKVGEVVSLYLGEIDSENLTKNNIKVDWELAGKYGKVTSSGTFLGVTHGTEKIRGVVTDSAGQKWTTDWLVVKVVGTPVSEISNFVSKNALLVGETVQAKVTVLPNDLAMKVTWESSNDNVIIDDKGLVTGKKVGIANIRAIVKDSTDNISYGNWVSIKVNHIPIQSSQVTLPASHMLPNETLQAKVINTPSNANLLALTLETSDSSIATISDTGLITAKKAGAVKVRSTVKDAENKIVSSPWVSLKVDNSRPQNDKEEEKKQNIEKLKKLAIEQGFYIDANNKLELATKENLKDLEKKIKNPIIYQIDKDGEMITVISDDLKK